MHLKGQGLGNFQYGLNSQWEDNGWLGLDSPVCITAMEKVKGGEEMKEVERVLAPVRVATTIWTDKSLWLPVAVRFASSFTSSTSSVSSLCTRSRSWSSGADFPVTVARRSNSRRDRPFFTSRSFSPPPPEINGQLNLEAQTLKTDKTLWKFVKNWNLYLTYKQKLHKLWSSVITNCNTSHMYYSVNTGLLL